VPRQRCIAHKFRNVLDRAPKAHQPEVKRALGKIFYAPDLEESPTACGISARDLGDFLAFYPFSQMRWKRLRTSNVIERAFREVRRRTDVVGRFPGESTALALISATLEHDPLRWRGVQMDEDILQAVARIRKEGRVRRDRPIRA